MHLNSSEMRRAGPVRRGIPTRGRARQRGRSAAVRPLGRGAAVWLPHGLFGPALWPASSSGLRSSNRGAPVPTHREKSSLLSFDYRCPRHPRQRRRLERGRRARGSRPFMAGFGGGTPSFVWEEKVTRPLWP